MMMMGGWMATVDNVCDGGGLEEYVQSTLIEEKARTAADIFFCFQ